MRCRPAWYPPWSAEFDIFFDPDVITSAAEVFAFVETAGRLTGLRLQDGRELAADLAVLGIGQAKLCELIGRFFGVQLDERGLIIADSSTGRTGNPKVFAGGDAVSGGQEVVNAAQEGKRAARAMCAAIGIAVRPESPMMAGHR